MKDIGLNKQSDYLYDPKIKTIVVLDACRPDVFGDIIGNYTNNTWVTVDSEACWTTPWYEKHWFGGRGKSVILTTAHIMILKQRDIGERFYLVNHVAKNSEGPNNEWAMPGITLKQAAAVSETRHKLKHLIHIIPPHQPLLSERWRDLKYTNYRVEANTYEQGYFDRAKKGYRENLIIALGGLFEYIDLLHKPIIITSDHGEFIGETPDDLGKPNDGRPVYGHKYKDDRLREVPLLILD